MSLLVWSDGEVFDCRFDALDEVVAVVDGHLARLEASLAGCSGLLDQYEVYDSFDHFIGIGLAACQVYMAGICRELGLSKRQALGLGPLHESGQPKARLINHAANYWKHSDEWGDSPDSLGLRTLDGLSVLDFDGIDFPLMDMLRDIGGFSESRGMRLRCLLAELLAWRDSALHESRRSDDFHGTGV
jgi:hypothetical protein